MLNFEFIYKKAKDSRIDTVTILREYWQLLFLQKLYEHKESKEIFFKGGTAIRFLYNSFRFSEDLDFTSIGKKEEIELLLLKVFRYFRDNTNFSLEFKKERVFVKFEEESLKYRFLFQPKKSSQKVSIRFDVSFREKPLTKEETVLIPFDYPISPYPLVLHLNSAEILAEKIRALFIRSKPRDLFDVWYLLTKKIAIDEKILKKKFKLYPGVSFNKNNFKKIIEAYDEDGLKKDLNQFLPENFRHFYKSLKKSTLGELRARS